MLFALLFSCLGRGRDLYGEPDVDARILREALGLCPIGARNDIHGFTASLGLFRPRDGRSG